MAEPPSSQEVYITIHVMGKIGHVKSVLFAHTQKENDCENVKEYYKHFYYIEFQVLHYRQNVDIPCFIVLCCTELCRHCCTFFPHKKKDCGKSASCKSIFPIFSNSICSLHVSVSHFGNFHNISKIFLIIFVMVICDW